MYTFRGEHGRHQCKLKTHFTILAHRKAWCFSCTKYIPTCLNTWPSLAGTQKDYGFVLIMGDHIRLLLPFNLRILFVLPPSGLWAFSHGTPRAQGMPRSPFLGLDLKGLLVRSSCVSFYDPRIYKNLFSINVWHLNNIVDDCGTIRKTQ